MTGLTSVFRLVHYANESLKPVRQSG